MQRIFYLIILVSVGLAAQTKQQLIASIITVNEVHDLCHYEGCVETEAYKTFLKLKKMCSVDDFMKLAKHKNAVVRMYAVRELINAGQGSVTDFFLHELKNDAEVYMAGNMGYHLSTPEIVYFEYKNLQKVPGKNEDMPLTFDVLDSIILYRGANCFLTDRCLTETIIPQQHLPRVEQLAFIKHNSYALEHLVTHYPEQYKNRIDKYWENFAKENYKGKNADCYYSHALELIAETEDMHLKKLAIRELKKDKSWKNNWEGFAMSLPRGITMVDVLNDTYTYPLTKEQLKHIIISQNKIQCDCGFMNCDEDEPHYLFGKLKEMSTTAELQQLAKHKNNALRMFAAEELIWKGQIDIPELFLSEYKKKTFVEEECGCIIGQGLTYNIVYHTYWNHISGGSITGDDEEYNTEDIAKFETDEVMLKLDSIVLSKHDMYWLLYSRAFENRIYPESYLPRIEELAFKYNNSVAQVYLITHYPEKYKERIRSYWYNDFPKAKFKSYNDRFYFTDIVEMMLASGDEALKPIISKKLKKFKDWQYAGLNFENLLKEKGIPFNQRT